MLLILLWLYFIGQVGVFWCVHVRCLFFIMVSIYIASEPYLVHRKFNKNIYFSLNYKLTLNFELASESKVLSYALNDSPYLQIFTSLLLSE